MIGRPMQRIASIYKYALSGIYFICGIVYGVLILLVLWPHTKRRMGLLKHVSIAGAGLLNVS